MKKTLPLLMAALLSIAFISCATNKGNSTEPSKTKEPAKISKKFDKSQALVDSGSKEMKSMTGLELVYDMKTGWNLGNTLDALGGNGLNSETSWGQPRTTKAIIDGIARSGFKTIRMPATWHNHIIDDNYTIDPKWMARVKEIVDWAIEDDLYVILNTHHDNYGHDNKMPYRYGYYPTAMNEEESLSFLTNTWGQIALAFNNGYDEHLVFETLNEPRLSGTNNEWNYSSSNPVQKAAQEILNKFNQEIVNVIRASGGNNAKRLIVMPGYACSPSAALSNDFVLPEDPANNLGVAVHMYDPYDFAMNGNGTSKYDPKMANSLQYTFKNLESKFVKKNIPVYIGEYGCVNKENTEDRILWFNTFVRQTRKMGITCILWDNQAFHKDSNGYTEKFGFYIRNEQKWFVPEITETIMNAADLK
ncbi:MAG: glycoside hydrolase family 5 protein [Treponema sp.]|nr:glycoside hydrolase family 5 protein [Treponema sp.]